MSARAQVSPNWASQVIGASCSACRQMEVDVRDVIARLSLNAAVERVDDLEQIMRFGLFVLPGLAVNGQVISAGLWRPEADRKGAVRVVCKEDAMSSQPVTGACCPKSDDNVTQLRLGEGHTVGIMGLSMVFEQLLAMGRKPDEATDAELLGMVRAQKNYIPSNPNVETKYAAALRSEYAAVHARRR